MDNCQEYPGMTVKISGPGKEPPIGTDTIIAVSWFNLEHPKSRARNHIEMKIEICRGLGVEGIGNPGAELTWYGNFALNL
jgi:hypothetical protein